MARIAGVELQDKSTIGYALTKIKGIGWARSEEVLNAVGMDKLKRVKDVTTDELNKITAELDKYTIEGDLMREVRQNIARLRETGTYRGTRHRQGLPARGQRTKSNARTKRGKRKTVGSFRKDMLTKMQQPA